MKEFKPDEVQLVLREDYKDSMLEWDMVCNDGNQLSNNFHFFTTSERIERRPYFMLMEKSIFDLANTAINGTRGSWDKREIQMTVYADTPFFLQLNRFKSSEIYIRTVPKHPSASDERLVLCYDVLAFLQIAKNRGYVEKHLDFNIFHISFDHWVRYDRKRIATMTIDDFKYMLRQLDISSDKIVLVPDPVYIATMKTESLGNTVPKTFALEGDVIVCEASAISFIFEKAVCKTWETNGCKVHENCCQFMKEQLHTVIDSYRAQDCAFYVTWEKVNNDIKMLNENCMDGTQTLFSLDEYLLEADGTIPVQTRCTRYLANCEKFGIKSCPETIRELYKMGTKATSEMHYWIEKLLYISGWIDLLYGEKHPAPMIVSSFYFLTPQSQKSFVAQHLFRHFFPTLIGEPIVDLPLDAKSPLEILARKENEERWKKPSRASPRPFKTIKNFFEQPDQNRESWCTEKEFAEQIIKNKALEMYIETLENDKKKHVQAQNKAKNTISQLQENLKKEKEKIKKIESERKSSIDSRDKKIMDLEDKLKKETRKVKNLEEQEVKIVSKHSLQVSELEAKLKKEREKSAKLDKQFFELKQNLLKFSKGDTAETLTFPVSTAEQVRQVIRLTSQSVARMSFNTARTEPTSSIQNDVDGRNIILEAYKEARDEIISLNLKKDFKLKVDCLNALCTDEEANRKRRYEQFHFEKKIDHYLGCISANVQKISITGEITELFCLPETPKIPEWLNEQYEKLVKEQEALQKCKQLYEEKKAPGFCRFKTCYICHDDFEKGDKKIKCAKCGTDAHKNCLVKWYQRPESKQKCGYCTQ